MKTHQISCVMSLLVIACSMAYCQDIDKLKSVVPPSPTAASLGKYAEWPVNLFTGVPGVSLPLIELKGRTTSVPVTLNYHASGIRVSEIASWVGLGFSLDAGGVITRSVRGLPDDNGGYLLMRNIYSDPGDLSSEPSGLILDDSIYRFRVATARADSEPDSYNLNAMGRSYKLFFGGDGKIITQPASGLKITYRFEGGTSPLSADGTLMYWAVVLEDGTKLEFGSVEIVKNFKFGPDENGIFTPVTAWYLHKITSPTNEIVTFTYDEEEIEQAISYSETDQLRTDNQTFLPLKKSIYRPRVSTMRLTRIETTLDYAVFVPVQRQDLAGGNALSEIRQYSKIDGSCTRKFAFSYTYSESPVSNNVFTFSIPEAKYRLKLKSITEMSANDQSSRFWDFGYNSKKLPSRVSYAQDHWGYFNGATSNTSLLPFSASFNPLIRPWGNREADSSSVVAEMLSKVTYPTGGYSEFKYEPNSYLQNQAQHKDSTAFITLASPNYTFETVDPIIVTLELTAAFHDYNDITTTLAKLLIREADNDISGSVTILKGDLSGNPAGTTKSIQIFLPTAGEYTLELSVPHLEVFDSESLVASMQYKHYLGMAVSATMTGGVRIRSIFDYDGETSTVSKRFFEYEDAFIMQNIVVENYLSNTLIREYTCQWSEGGGSAITFEQYPTLNRSSNVNGTFFTSGIVGYGRVTTHYGDNNENGKTVSWFTNEHDSYEERPAVIPYLPAVDRSWRRGQLTLKRDHNLAGDILAEERNEYEYINPVTITAFKSSFKFTLASNCVFYESLSDVLLVGYYDVLSEQLVHKRNTKVQFSKRPDGSIDSIKTVQNFFYDTPGNYQPTRTETTDSKDNVLVTINRTPLEKASMVGVSSWTAVIDSMVSRNIVAPVLQSESYIGSTLISRATTKYELWPNSFILPESVSIKLGNNPEETRLQLVSYDDVGNLFEQRKTSDALHSYIYDYYQSSPIAEIINASASSSAYTGFESNGSGRWTIAGSTRSTTDYFTGSQSYPLSAGALSLSGLNTEASYIVSLWGKSAASVTINGNTIAAGLSRNGWNLYQTTITGTASVAITGSGNIDDVRLHPVGSQMSTYTYGPFGITSQTSPNHSTVFYEYDDLGRMTLVRDHERQIVKRTKYYYKAR